MKRKQITSLLLSTILTVSILTAPFAQMSAFAAEGTTAREQETLPEDQSIDEGAQEEASPEQSAVGEEVVEDTNTGTEESTEAAGTEDSTDEDTEDESAALSGDQVDDAQGDPDIIDSVADDRDAGDPETDASETDSGIDVPETDPNSGTIDPTDPKAADATPIEDFVFKGSVHARTEGQEAAPGEKDGKSPDDLFADYVERSFNGDAGRVSLRKSRAARSAASNLTVVERAFYNSIATCLPQIAAGERSSTVFEVYIDDIGLEKTAWTAAELGVESVFELDESGNVILDENGYAFLSMEAADAAEKKAGYDLMKVLGALQADYPYQLYWYEKTQNTVTTGIEMYVDYDAAADDYVVVIVGSILVSCPVAEEFSAGEYMVDTSVGQAVQSSVANAASIVSKYSGSSDYDKLSGYKDEICGLVSYNDEAAEGGVSYGNPWQMIWVFDEDPSTNVVCEGYSKAFKYLCDQSDFSGDVSCITVTGTMSGGTGEGPHMWNIVRMGDGKNYLADLTNSDAGSIGENGELFLAVNASGSAQEGYTFRFGGEDEINYIYDELTLSLFSEGELTLGQTEVTPDPLEITKQPASVSAKAGENVSLHVEVNADDVTYQWQWSGDGTSWEDCAFEGNASDTLSFPMEEDFSGKLFRCAVTRGDESVFSNSAGITLDQQQVIIDQGRLGKSITWTLDEQGNLLVEGSGAMYDYAAEISAPIAVYADTIKHISISDGITYIGDYVFHNQYSVNDTITIPDSVRRIGDYAFSECSAIGFSLPEGLVSIGDYAFSQSVYFNEITIPGSVQTLGEHMFSACYGLKNVSIKGSVSKIGTGFFENCTELRTVEIPDTVTEIADEAFAYCFCLEEVDIPDSVTQIGGGVFINCRSLQSVQLPDGLSIIPDSLFFYCESLNSVNIPDTVTSIGQQAFSDCYVLAQIQLPEGLESIGERAFQLCDNLAKIYIPESVSYIDDNAFAGTYNAVIYGIGGSSAKTFADGMGISFVPVMETADGHVYRKWVTVKAATCTEGGSRKKTCEFCGEVLTEEIPAAGHKWNKEYTVDVKPTYTEEGTESIHCSACGISKEGTSRAVAKLPKPVKLLTISGIVDKTYNKAAQTQKIVVKDGSKTLKVNTDYVVTYKNNVNAGTASVTITGKGNYTGSVTKSFTIKKAANKITANNIVRTYSSKAQSFALGVKIASGTPKYTASSKSVTVTAAGRATVKAKSIGKLTITITAPENKNYSKTTKKITITVNPTKTAIAGVSSPAAGRMKVAWKKNAVGTGYQIQYATSAKFAGAKSVLVTKNTIINKTFTGLAKGKKYYVRLRTYKTVGGVKYYSGWSAVKTVTVRK